MEHSLSPIHTNRNMLEDAQFLSPEIIHWRIVTRPHAWRPPTDVYETEHAIIVRIEIAGMKETEFSISMQERYLSVRGSRSDMPERRAYHQMEIPFGEFEVEFELPVPVIIGQVEANYRDGFLRITLPKARATHISIGE